MRIETGQTIWTRNTQPMRQRLCNKAPAVGRAFKHIPNTNYARQTACPGAVDELHKLRCGAKLRVIAGALTKKFQIGRDTIGVRVIRLHHGAHASITRSKRRQLRINGAPQRQHLTQPRAIFLSRNFSLDHLRLHLMTLGACVGFFGALFQRVGKAGHWCSRIARKGTLWRGLCIL